MEELSLPLLFSCRLPVPRGSVADHTPLLFSDLWHLSQGFPPYLQDEVTYGETENTYDESLANGAYTVFAKFVQLVSVFRALVNHKDSQKNHSAHLLMVSLHRVALGCRTESVTEVVVWKKTNASRQRKPAYFFLTTALEILTCEAAGSSESILGFKLCF